MIQDSPRLSKNAHSKKKLFSKCSYFVTKQVIAKPKPIDLKRSSNNPKQTLASSGLIRIHLAFKKTAISISVASPLAIILQCAMPQSCGQRWVTVVNRDFPITVFYGIVTVKEESKSRRRRIVTISTQSFHETV